MYIVCMFGKFIFFNDMFMLVEMKCMGRCNCVLFVCIYAFVCRISGG